jgi:hypothetical protein
MKQSFQIDNIQPILIFKVLIILFIVIATFFDINSYVFYLDNKVSKILMLAIIVLTLMVDIHLGILLVIAFMILIIQFNGAIISDISQKKLELFMSSLPAPLKHDINSTPLSCDNVIKNKISDDIANYTTDKDTQVVNGIEYPIDPKIKNYEVFVKMMTSKNQLDIASNSAFLE